MAISEILNISKKAIFNYRSAINVTAKNIANINTEGYKRRRVELSSISESIGGFNQLGGELISENIVRIRNAFVENQVNYEKQNLAKYKMDESLFGQIEDIFSEPTDAGLSKVLQDFWESWNSLALEPESIAARNIVKDKGVILTNTIQRYYNNLVELQRNTKDEIVNKVERVNNILSQLAELNKKIVSRRTSDLLDQRDKLLSELSDYLNVKIKEEKNASLTILAGNQIVLSGDLASEITVDLTMENNVYKAELYTDGTTRLANIDSGEIGSMMNIINNEIPNMISTLDNIAISISLYVNMLHSRGYTLDGKTGVYFFKTDVQGASNFDLNPEIVRDPSLVVASSKPDEPGNNEVAVAIHDLQFRDIISDTTIEDYYNSFISNVGAKAQEAEFLRSSQEKVVTNLQNTLDSISGVSLDEEMTNMIEFQHAYEASAKMIKTVDEMIVTILNMV
ncbi:MAG: flagellar hook-associated protein FlgK [Candidatus Marinimicrobia bacterium]|nr:flagellar hook-associated protein FlgK [Candidatus Neomarinimicrobiota bacterium]